MSSLKCFFLSHLFSPQTSGKGFCTTRHFLSSCCSKTSSFTAGELVHHKMGVSGWKKEKNKCYNIFFALSFKYSWICRAYSSAPSLSPSLWFCMALNHKSFFLSFLASLVLLSSQLFCWVLSFYIKLKFIVFYFPYARELVCKLDSAIGVVFFFLFALFSPHTWHTRWNSFTPFHLHISISLNYPLWFSLPLLPSVAMSLLWNLQRLIGHQGNTLTSIQLKYIYSGEPDPLTNALPMKAKWKSSVLAYLFSLVVSTLYFHSFISWVLLGGELFKARAMSQLYLYA